MTDSDSSLLAVRLEGISKSFESGGQQEEILHSIDLNLYAGEVVAFLGPSGSGKSTLLNILGLLSAPDAGNYYLNDESTQNLSYQDTANLRLNNISFVFQSFHLIEHKNTLANVELPLKYLGIGKQDRKDRAQEILNQLGLEHRMFAKVSTLSGGEKQRVAIARALITSPRLLLCDEPTGSLDSERSQEVIKMLKTVTGAEQTTVIVTHDPTVAEQCDRTISIQDGNLTADPYAPPSTPASPVQEGLDNTHPNKSQPSSTKTPIKWVRLGVSEAIDATTKRMRRNLFTILGVALGVASLVLTVGLVATISGQISSAFNVYLAQHINLTQSSTTALSSQEALDLMDSNGFKQVQQLNGVVSASIIRPLSAEALTVTTAPENRADFPGRQQVRILSATPNIFNTQEQEILAGRSFDEGHMQRHETVAVISQSLAQNMGIQWQPGLTLYIANQPVSVIGVAAENTALSDYYGAVYMPLGVELANSQAGSTIISIATKPGAANQVGLEAPTALMPQKPSLFTAGVPPSPEKLRDAVSQSQSAMLLLLSAVTLVIGAVGIMNTYLVAVIERQKEIGIRLALGMRPGGIITQFITEATLTSALGAIFGVIVAINGIAIISVLNQWTPIISLQTIGLGILAGLCIGGLAGIYPAWKASRVDPVKTLNS